MWRQTFFDSAITPISSSERSFGWEVMNRIRSMPSIFSTSRKSPAKVVGSLNPFP